MKRAAWLVPSFLEGSGGHRTILQNAEYLTRKGFECDVYVEDNGFSKNSDEIYKTVEKFFGECNVNFYCGFNITKKYDIVFATVWYTAKIVRDLDIDAKKAYFIQDFEALFNPMGDGYLLACNSYCYGLHPITIGRWLTYKMINEYGLKSQYFDFCADHNIYKKDKNIQKENAICFIYQPEKPRRCSVIGIEALGIIKYLRPDIKIYLYGSSVKGNVWFEHTNLEIISIEQCNELYNKCRVGLCISSSNPSRIPFEMMCTGLPVIDLYMENNLYDMPDEGTQLAYYTPESIAQAVISLYDDKSKCTELSEYGMEYMKNKNLEDGYQQFYKAVENIMNDTIPEEVNCEKLYKKGPIIADVINMSAVKANSKPINMNYSKGLIGKLKNNPYIRRNKTIRKLWVKLRGY